MTESYLVQNLNRRASRQPKTRHTPAQLNTAMKITIDASSLSWLPSGFRMFLWRAAVGRGVPGGACRLGDPCPFTYAPLREKKIGTWSNPRPSCCQPSFGRPTAAVVESVEALEGSGLEVTGSFFASNFSCSWNPRLLLKPWVFCSLNASGNNDGKYTHTSNVYV